VEEERVTRFVTGLAILAAAVALSACGPVSGLETQARILSEPPCTDFFFPVYFGRRSAGLSGAAGRVIRNAGRHAEGCKVARVEVVGLADPRQVGGQAALELSRERARRLGAALQAAGLPAPQFQLDPLGQSAPSTPSVAPRRRADVFVRFER
jgi:outer membrane protein OmpA-like peptidoglycan-associated protein